MFEHLSLQQQTALIEHTLDSRLTAQALAHLAACAACRAQVQGLRQVGALAPLWEDTALFHLSYEQLAGYVTETLPEIEREIAANHLAACEFCAVEIRELQRTQAELRELHRAHRPGAVGSKLKQAWPAFGWRAWWPAGLAWGALALLVLSLSGWWRWQAKQARPTELALTRQAETQPVAPAPNTTPASQPADTLLAIVDHGQRLSWGGNGELSSSLPLSQPYAALLKRTLAEQRLSLPAVLNELKSSPRDLRSGEVAPQQFALLAPRGKVVQTDRPVFRWQAVPDATSYTVAVLDQNFNSVLTSEVLTKTAWQPRQPLPRGRSYVWQVTAQVGAQQLVAPAVTAPEARFQILAQDKAEELQHAAATYKQSHLLLGTLYAQAGLLTEAERELQALLAENPQSAVVQKLLQQVRRAR